MTGRVAPPPSQGMVRVRMCVAYDGSGFSGFAKNADVRTVEGELEAALARVLRHPVHMSCAGRTDRGVHARGQVVSFDADAVSFDPVSLDRAMNRMVGPEIAVDGVEHASSSFDARFSCTGRTYRYRILNRRVADPPTRHVVWHVREPLDVAAMTSACDQIIGSHDFTSFSKKNKSRPEESFVRSLRSAAWAREGGMVRFDVTANAFTHQMVRSLVGMFVEIGRGRRRAVDMGNVLRARDRDAAPGPAPPQGLVLWRAHYD